MVEWKKLGDVANLIRGKVISKDYVRDNEGDYPVYSSQTADNGVFGRINSYMFDGEYLTWTTDGAYAGTIFRRKGRFNITNVCGLIDLNDNKVNQDFLFYWLSKTAKGYVLEGMGNPKLMSNVASNIAIPIPSLSEQTRIVGILDTFTAAIENLKQQIAERRKQYEHYRDQLLDLEGKEGVEMKTVGEIALKISSGKNKTKNETGLYPVFGSTGIIAYTDDYVFDKPLILVARVGANAGFVHMSYGKYDITDNTLYVELSPNVKQKYILYLLVKENINKYAKGGGQPLITASILKDIIIPLPSLAEQQRIVGILDTFEASIANLEAQLKEREKQYEYYRNKLLTFE